MSYALKCRDCGSTRLAPLNPKPAPSRKPYDYCNGDCEHLKVSEKEKPTTHLCRVNGKTVWLGNECIGDEIE